MFAADLVQRHIGQAELLGHLGHRPCPDQRVEFLAGESAHGSSFPLSLEACGRGKSVLFAPLAELLGAQVLSATRFTVSRTWVP